MHSQLALLVCFLAVVYGLHPVVFFPGYSLSKLAVTVNGGSEAGCPTSGSFVVEYQMEATQNGFTENCMMNYLNITVNPSTSAKPFSNRPDVTISIPGREIGSTECIGSTTYDAMIAYFTSNGYTTGTATASFLAACYDWRMAPNHDVLNGDSFVNNTFKIVKQAYVAAGNQKVWLIGHSNGPIMALYFLNQLTAEEKRQYIAGFIPISGNFAGQGLLPSVFIEGLSVVDFNFLPASAGVHTFFTANYFSAPQPDVFTGDRSMVFFKTNSQSFYVTASDFDSFFTQSGNTFGLQHWRDYVGLVGPHTPPGVYTYAIWGNNISTVVGLSIDSFSNTTILDYLTRNGDINQEDIDNESCMVWNTTMPSGCFDHWIVWNVNHFELNSNQQVIEKIFSIVQSLPSVTCSDKAPSTSGAYAIAALFSLLLTLVAIM